MFTQIPSLAWIVVLLTAGILMGTLLHQQFGRVWSNFWFGLGHAYALLMHSGAFQPEHLSLTDLVERCTSYYSGQEGPDATPYRCIQLSFLSECRFWGFKFRPRFAWFTLKELTCSCDVGESGRPGEGMTYQWSPRLRTSDCPAGRLGSYWEAVRHLSALGLLIATLIAGAVFGGLVDRTIEPARAVVLGTAMYNGLAVAIVGMMLSLMSFGVITRMIGLLVIPVFTGGRYYVEDVMDNGNKLRTSAILAAILGIPVFITRLVFPVDVMPSLSGVTLFAILGTISGFIWGCRECQEDWKTRHASLFDALAWMRGSLLTIIALVLWGALVGAFLGAIGGVAGHVTGFAISKLPQPMFSPAILTIAYSHSGIVGGIVCGAVCGFALHGLLFRKEWSLHFETRFPGSIPQDIQEMIKELEREFDEVLLITEATSWHDRIFFLPGKRTTPDLLIVASKGITWFLVSGVFSEKKPKSSAETELV